jgi:LemA protein
MTGLIVVAVIVVVLVAWLAIAYNGLVTARNRTQEAWSQIDVELKRRHDLIPNLVETVRGYAGHERGTLEAVTNARANAVSAGATGDVGRISAAENALTQSLRSLFAVSENYPDLKAITAFTNLQEQLTATEDKIEFSRRYYNGSVRDYNTALQTVPTSFIGSTFGFRPYGFFEADAADRAVPQVSFGPPGPTNGPPAAGEAPPAPPSQAPPPGQAPPQGSSSPPPAQP